MVAVSSIRVRAAHENSQDCPRRSIFARFCEFAMDTVRRRTFSCWRSTRFSASSAALERNRPTSAHQINLQRSLIAHNIKRFAFNCYPMMFAVGTMAARRLGGWAGGPATLRIPEGLSGRDDFDLAM